MPLLSPKDRRRIFGRLRAKWASARSDTFRRLRESSFATTTSSALNVASDRRMHHAAHKESLADRYLPLTFRRRLEKHLDDAGDAALCDSPRRPTTVSSPAAVVSAKGGVSVNFYGIESDDAMSGFMEGAVSSDHVLALKALFSHWATSFGGSAIPLLPLSAATADIAAVVQRGIERSIEHRRLNGAGPLHLVPGSNNSDAGGPACDRWAALVFDWLELLDCLSPPLRRKHQEGGGVAAEGAKPTGESALAGEEVEGKRYFRKKAQRNSVLVEDCPSFITLGDWLVLTCCDMAKDWAVVAALRNAYETFRTHAAVERSHWEAREAARKERRLQKCVNGEPGTDGGSFSEGSFMAEGEDDDATGTDGAPTVLSVDLLRFMESALCQLSDERRRRRVRPPRSEDVYSDYESGSSADERASAKSEHQANDASPSQGAALQLNFSNPAASTVSPHNSPPRRPTSVASAAPSPRHQYSPRPPSAAGASGASSPSGGKGRPVSASAAAPRTPRAAGGADMQHQQPSPSSRGGGTPRSSPPAAIIGTSRMGAPSSVTGVGTDVEQQRRNLASVQRRRKTAGVSARREKATTPRQRERTVEKLLACGLCPIDPAEWGVLEQRRYEESSGVLPSLATAANPSSCVAHPSARGTQDACSVEGISVIVPQSPDPPRRAEKSGHSKLESTGPTTPVALPLSFSTCLLLLLPHRTKMYLVKSNARVYPQASTLALSPDSGGAVADRCGDRSEAAASSNAMAAGDRRRQAAAFDPRGASRYYGAVTPGAREAVLYYREVMQREGGPNARVPRSTTLAGQRVQTFEPKTKSDITKRETRDLRFARKVWS